MQIDQPVLKAKAQEREKSLETARSRISQQRQEAPLESAQSVVSSTLTHQHEGGNAKQVAPYENSKNQQTKRVEINNNLRTNTSNQPSGPAPKQSPPGWTGRKLDNMSREKLKGMEAIYDRNGGRDSKLSKNSLKQLDGAADIKSTKKVEQYVREHSPVKMTTGGDHPQLEPVSGSIVDGTANTISGKADIDSGVHRSAEISPAERIVKSKSKQKLMTGEDEQRSKELIQQFGVNKGKQYYGAIRELEEFLDPNVLQDDDFQFDDKTRDEIKTIETKRVKLVEATGLPKNNSMVKTGRQVPMQNSLTGPTRSREHMLTSVGHDTANSRGIGGKSLNTQANPIKKQMAGIIYTQSDQGDGRLVLPSQSMQQYIQTPLREVKPLDPSRKYDVSYLRQQRASQNVDAINSSLLRVAVGDDSQYEGNGSIAGGTDGGRQFDVNSVATYPARLEQTGPIMQPLLRNPLALAPIKRKSGRNTKGKSRTNIRQRPIGVAALNSQYNSLQSSVQGPATLHAYPAAEPVSPAIRAQLQTQAGKRTQNTSQITGARNSNVYGLESSHRGEMTAEQANLKYLTQHLQMQGQTPDPRLAAGVEAPGSVFKGKRMSTHTTSLGPEVRKFTSAAKKGVATGSRNDSVTHADSTSAREGLPRIGSRTGVELRSDAQGRQTFGKNMNAGAMAFEAEPDGQHARIRVPGNGSSLQKRRFIPQFQDYPGKNHNVQLKRNGHFFDNQKIGKMYRNDQIRKHVYNSQQAQNAQINAALVQKMAQQNWSNHKREMAAIGAICSEDCPHPHDSAKSRKTDKMRRTGGFISPKVAQLNSSQLNPLQVKRIKERRRTDESIGQQEIQVARQSLMKARQSTNPPDSVRNAKTQQVKKRGALRANHEHFMAKASQPRIGTEEEPLTPDQLIEGTDARAFSKALAMRKQSKATVEGPTTSTIAPVESSGMGGLPSGLFSNLDQVSSTQVDARQHGNLNLVNINVNVNMSDGDKLTKKERELLSYINKKIASVEEQKKYYLQQQVALLTGQKLDADNSFELAKVKHKKKATIKRKKELLHALLKQPQPVDPQRQSTVPKNRHRSRPSGQNSLHDVTRSMPSNQLMNKLVSRGAYASSRRGDRDEDYPMSSRIQDPKPRAARLRSSQINSIDAKSRGGLGQGKHQLSVDDPRRSKPESQRRYELSANRQVRRTNFSPSPSSQPKHSRRTEQLNNTLKAPRRELGEDSIWMAGQPVGRVLPSNSSYREKIRHSRSLSKERAHLSPASGGSDMSLHSGVMSEVDRQMHRNDKNKKQRVMLDQAHLAELKKPENFHNTSYLHPEKLTRNAKKDLDQLSFGSKKAARRDPAHGLDHPMRSNSAQNVMIAGLNYKFKLDDLSKYSQKLKYKDINWKIKLSALGKKIPDIKQRKKILVKGSHFNTLLKLLRHTDWATTPVYHQFQLNGRWKHIDNSIYSEIELKYQVSFLAKYVDTENADDIAQNEAQQLVATHFVKTMHTCEVLMNQLNMMYYLEKIKLYFVDEEPTIQQLQKLMSRCLKLYELINCFMKAFKLIEKTEIATELGKPDATLLQRLRTAVVLLLKENPVLPAFTFKGSDLLAQVKSDLRVLGFEEPEDTPRSPPRSKGRNKKFNADGGGACALCPHHAGAVCPHKSSKHSQEDDGEVLSLGDGFAI